MSNGLKGRKQTPEHIAKRLEGCRKGGLKTGGWNKGKPAPWVKKQMLEHNPVKSPEVRKKLSENNCMKNPEIKAKMLETRKNSLIYREAQRNARPTIIKKGKYPRFNLPKGYVMHHIDFNQNNNHPTNLFPLKRGDHNRLHLQINKFVKQLMNNGYIPESLN